MANRETGKGRAQTRRLKLLRLLDYLLEGTDETHTKKVQEHKKPTQTIDRLCRFLIIFHLGYYTFDRGFFLSA